MRKPPSLSIVINFILFAGLAAIWIAFAPTLIGGRASYVVVNGNSMEPGFHKGDLVIVRAASTYQVGDIVTYRNAELNAFVIHRIIAIQQDHYVFKGDNNSWIDMYHPIHEELIGKLWIHMPKLGKAMAWLRLPINMGLTTALLGGILMASIMIKPKRQRKGKNRISPNFGGMLEGGLYLFGFFALAFLVLSIFAFIRPLTHAADKIQYQQDSHFSYSATGTPVIYDTEMVRSGEPVFPRLTCFLNIGFTYNALGDQLQGVSGNHQLIARVMEEQSGWQRTIPLNQQTAFSGNSFSTLSTLDLCQVVALVIDDVHFFLTTPKGQENPLHLSKQSSADNSNLEASTLSLLGWKLAIGTVREIALLGLALSLSGLLLTSSSIFMTARRSQEDLIRLRYGPLLVNVYERDFAPAAMLIDVTTIDELAKLAERNSTVILHMTFNFLHSYLVQCNGITYRYVFSTGKRGVAQIEPPRQQLVEYRTNVKENKIVEAQPAEGELIEYVINKSRTAKVEVEETVMLRKLRL